MRAHRLFYIVLCWEFKRLFNRCVTVLKQTCNTYQKLWPHLVMCASSIISKQMGLEKQTNKKKAVFSACQLFKHSGKLPKPRVSNLVKNNISACPKQKTHQTKSLLLSSYEFNRPLYRGAWWRDFFLLPEDAEGLLREAKPPRDDGTAAKVGTVKPPSPAGAAGLREGTTFPELLPLLVTALLPPPPFVFPAPPVPPPPPPLLLVLGTEPAPPALCCGRLFDIMRGRPETPRKPLRCCSQHPDSAAMWLLERLGPLAGLPAR